MLRFKFCPSQHKINTGKFQQKQTEKNSLCQANDRFSACKMTKWLQGISLLDSVQCQQLQFTVRLDLTSKPGSFCAPPTAVEDGFQIGGQISFCLTTAKSIRDSCLWQS